VSGYRPDAETLVEPGITEGLIDGSALQLVTVRLFDNDGDQPDPSATEVFAHLRPGEARELAFSLLTCAEHATRLTDQAAG